MLYYGMQDLIGNTPLVQLTHVGIKTGVSLFAKMELMNPSGSVKDRTGLYMIKDAQRRGLLKKGGTIIEATAGNTGLGIAMAALNAGYRIIFVVPDKFSVEKQTLLRAMGAEIINTPRADGMRGAAKKADELLQRFPASVTLRQFENPSNPRAHYETTGKEIYEDMNGKIDYFVAGAGSGGTYSGIVQYLKEQNPRIQGILADPEGSTMGGGAHADYDIEGIGNDFVPKTMNLSLVDEVLKISDQQAAEAARVLAAKEGIFAGTSSGAALAASLMLADRVPSGNIVTVFPDRGDRYFSKQLYG